MAQTIPAYTISHVAATVASQAQPAPFYLRDVTAPFHLLADPHRTAFYAVGLCFSGNALLQANLETHRVQEGSVILLGPEVIRKWSIQTPDYRAKALFFTEECFTATRNGHSILKQYPFYLHPLSPKVVNLSKGEKLHLQALMTIVGDAMQSSSKRRAEIVQAYIVAILSHVADIYEGHYMTQQVANTPAVSLVNRFKCLLLDEFVRLRSVTGYAERLNVSAKHLSETIKTETGRTAGEWIHDAVVQEGKVYLKQTDQTVAQIADSLHFADASVFAKFFRRYAGCSPIEYRRQTSYAGNQ